MTSDTEAAIQGLRDANAARKRANPGAKDTPGDLIAAHIEALEAENARLLAERPALIAGAEYFANTFNLEHREIQVSAHAFGLMEDFDLTELGRQLDQLAEAEWARQDGGDEPQVITVERDNA